MNPVHFYSGLILFSAVATILALPGLEFPHLSIDGTRSRAFIRQKLPMGGKRGELTQRNFLLLSGLRAELIGGSTAHHALQYIVASQFASELPKTHVALETFGNVTVALMEDAKKSQLSGLSQLAIAWDLSDDTGAPLADLVEQILKTIERDEKSNALIQTETAGVKATVFVLGLLPIIGIFLAAMLGINVLSWFFSGVIGFICLFVGTMLELLGILWVRKMIASVAPQVRRELC